MVGTKLNVPLAPPVGPSLLVQSNPGVFREWAVFGNATYKFTDRFDVTGGARYGYPEIAKTVHLDQLESLTDLTQHF